MLLDKLRRTFSFMRPWKTSTRSIGLHFALWQASEGLGLSSGFNGPIVGKGEVEIPMSALKYRVGCLS